MIACGREGARRPRRWDTSQTEFRIPKPVVVAVADARVWIQGIKGEVLQKFMDDFDVAADSLERMGYAVGVSFRDSLHVVVWPDSFDLRPPRGGVTGYYLLAPGRQPRFVSRALAPRDLLKIVDSWSAELPRAADSPRTAVQPPADSGPLFALLSPDSVSGLPAQVRAELNRRGCLLPQEAFHPRPNNIIRGSFGAVGQTDWAVRCWHAHRSTVLVIWGGRAWCPEVIREGSDSLPPRMLAGGRGWYDGALARADSARIANIEVYGPDELAADSLASPAAAWRGYDGVEDIILEKASTVYYCLRGRWVSLGGAD